MKNDDLLAVALARGDTVAAAAVAAGCSERSAYRHLGDAAFRGRVAELRQQMVDRAAGKMADGLTVAADKLRALLDAKSETVQLGAARSLVELAVKLRESVELEQRLQALETQVAKTAGNDTRGDLP